MPLPNFFIIGASKSGTTSLYHYLLQHPDIFMSSDKEPAYFLYENEEEKFEFKNDELITDAFKKKTDSISMYSYDEYLSFFEMSQNEKAIGEATPDYLMHPKSPNYIYRNVPNAKIIAILRNPFDAAYSDFLMKQRDGVWKKNIHFLDALKAENLNEKNLRSHPNLIRVRMYDQGIKRYLDNFSTNQIRIFLYEDLKNPLSLLNDCFDLLEVSKDFQPDVTLKFNTATTMSTIKWLSPWVRKVPKPIKEGLKKMMNPNVVHWYKNKGQGASKAQKQTVTKCPDDAKDFLMPILKPSILRLQELIQRDLTHWLS